MNQECDVFLFDTDKPDAPVYAYIRYRAQGSQVSRTERTNEDSGQLTRRTISDYAQWEDSVARSTRRASEQTKETISQVSYHTVRPVVLFVALTLILFLTLRIRKNS